MKEVNKEEERLFPVGHPDFKNTQLPARDAKAHGNIQRSNVYPNSSFLTNWESIEDKIIWDVEVLSSGDYEVELYYTCAQEDIDRRKLTLMLKKYGQELEWDGTGFYTKGLWRSNIYTINPENDKGRWVTHPDEYSKYPIEKLYKK